MPNAGYGPHIETPEPAGSHVLVCRRQQYMGVFQVPKERERKWHTADAYASWALHAVRIPIILAQLGGCVTTNVTS